MDAYNTAMQAGARANSPEYDAWMQKRAELSLAASEAANAWLSDPDVGPSLRDLANFINRIVRRLLEILRVHHGQVVIPDPPRYGIRSVHIRFAAREDVSLSTEVIGRWLEVHTYGIQDFFGRPFEPVEWSEVAARFASEWKPSLIETLLANARSECERRFGNPRLAILEAATVVEILIKSAMTQILSPHAISPTAIDRIVRETSTADLVGIWLRPHVSSELFPLLEDLAVGIRERNELLHHNRRTVSFERAEAFVGAVGRVAEALQHHVPAN
jgi:hypothetical protein